MSAAVALAITAALIATAAFVGLILGDSLHTHEQGGRHHLLCFGFHDWRSTTPYTMECRRCGDGAV